MMAHISSSGTRIPLWMDNPDSVGWRHRRPPSPREGTFFGQIMVTDAANNLDGFYCDGPGADQNTVPDRLGANQSSVPTPTPGPSAGRAASGQAASRMAMTMAPVRPTRRTA